MKSFFLALAAGSALLLTACGNGPGAEVAALQKQIIEIHDKSMTHIPELTKLLEQVKADTASATAERRTRIVEALENANNTMNYWMQGWGDAEKAALAAPADSAKAQLEDQLKRIQEVDGMVASSLDSARAYLGVAAPAGGDAPAMQAKPEGHGGH